MPFVFLLLFALLSFQSRWPDPPPWVGPYGRVLLPWVLVLGFWAGAAVQVRRFCWQALRAPDRHADVYRRFLGWRRRWLLALIGGWLVVLYYLGWGQVAREDAGLLGAFPGAEAVQFTPLLIGLVLCWSRFYEFEGLSYELLHPDDRFISVWEYVAFQARHNLLLVVPPLLFLLCVRAVFLAFPLLERLDNLLIIMTCVLLVAALVCVPVILRLFLGLRPMPPGPLRSQLEAAARRCGFRFNDVLVWDTRGTVANAMVSGAVPWVRYVILTDLLIDKLTPAEVEAVFGHEVGHIKHHHMLLYVLFFLGSLVTLMGLWKYAETTLAQANVQAYLREHLPDAPTWLETGQVMAGPALLVLLAAYIFCVFGFLSRRCERQADLFGCRTVSCDAFISALEKVADLNGIPRHRPGLLASWQHPSIAQRVAFVARLRDDPALEPGFQRRLALTKWGLMAVMAASLALVVWALGDGVWDLLKMK
jgi:STE24 endopeptidase